MATQACVFGICFSVPSGLNIPGATTPAQTTTAAATPTTSNNASPAATSVSAGQTVSAAASTITAAASGAGATVTQTLIRTVTAAAPAAGGGAGGQSSVGPNGLPAIPSGITLPDNFQLPPGFQLPPKPKYQFDVDDRLSEAVIYAILLFPTLYLLWKHGRRGLFVWPLMAAFCIIRIAGDALFMWPGGSLLKIGTGWIVTTAMALMLLISFPLGLNFEAGAYIPTSSRAKRILILLATSFIFLLGTILGTIGAVPLSLINQIRNKPYNLKMARAGYILILLFLVLTWLHSILLYVKSSRHITPLSQRKRVRALLLGSILSIPFICVRVGRSIHYAFAYRSTLNVLNGSFVSIFVFTWLMQLMAFLIILCAGFVALHIKYAGRYHHRHQHNGRNGMGARDSALAGDEALDSDVDVKAEESAMAAGAAVPPRRHRFMQRHRRDDGVVGHESGVAGTGEDGYYVPEKQHAVREV